MTRLLFTCEKNRRAFTLIEMLVVVTIIVLLLAFSTPALMKTLQASRLSSAGDTLLGAISEAQQLAFAQSVPVELRFFSYAGDFAEDSPMFRSYQMLKVVTKVDGTGTALTISESLVPAGNLTKFPEGIVIPVSDELSKALSGDQLEDTKNGTAPGYAGVAGAKYCAIRFMPDGTCRKVGATTTADGVTQAALTFQTLAESFFTITYDIGATINVGNLPKNFYTIQIDPFTGKARNYKPGF